MNQNTYPYLIWEVNFGLCLIVTFTLKFLRVYKKYQMIQMTTRQWFAVFKRTSSFWYLLIHHHHTGVPRKLPSIHVVWCNRNHQFAFLLRPMADMYGEGTRKKMSLFQLAATITHSILESKILRCKVNFEIYFPKRKVMNKVSVKPWLLWKWTLSVKRSNGVQTQTLIYTFE